MAETNPSRDELVVWFVAKLLGLQREQFAEIGQLVRDNPALKADAATITRAVNEIGLVDDEEQTRAVQAGAKARHEVSSITDDQEALTAVAHAVRLLFLRPWLPEGLIENALAPFRASIPELPERLKRRPRRQVKGRSVKKVRRRRK